MVERVRTGTSVVHPEEIALDMQAAKGSGRCRAAGAAGLWLAGCFIASAAIARAPAPSAQAPATDPSGAVAAPAPASSTATPVALDTVMVTAYRRRQPAVEVPMHVTAVSARALAQTGARDLANYVATQPGVVFTSEGGPGMGKLIMRGVSNGNQTSPTVSEYIDDVPVGGSTYYASAAAYAFDPALLDLDHVEFLYGPQGTLYGAGSMGGLVKFVTTKPDTDHFFGYVGADLSDTPRGGLNRGAHAMLNAPLQQNTVALRVSVLDRHDTGVYAAVGSTPADHADDSHTRGARVQVQAYPTNRLSFNLSAMSQKLSADGLSMADYHLDGLPMSGGPFTRALNHREPFGQLLNLYAFHANYDLGFADLDWTSAYQQFTNTGIQDYPDVFIGLLNQMGPLFGVNQKLQTLYVDSSFAVHKSSQEVRVVSKPDPLVDWLAGLWLTREDVWQQFVLEGANLPPPPGNTALLRKADVSRFDELALYANATWHVTPRFDLALGLRASRNRQQLADSEDGPVAGSPGGFTERTREGNVNWLFTGKYHPDKSHSFYFRGASGWRPGGVQAPVTATIIGANPNAKTAFDSDSLQSYEIGYKGDYLDNRVSFSVDGYQIRWQHMQLYTYTLGNAIVENAGSARIDGLEFQLRYRQGRWRFDAAGAFTDARTVTATPAAHIAKGAQLPYSALRTLVLGIRREGHLAGAKTHLGANFRASSRRNAGFDNDDSDPNFNLPGYGMLDLDAGIAFRDGRGVRIDAFIRNALNRRVPMGTLNSEVINFLASVGGPMLVHQSTPRTIGVSVTVPFGVATKDD